MLVEGKTVDVPAAAQGIEVLNLQSYMGGSNLWKGNPAAASADDGKFEICAVYGALHLGAIKGGIARSNQLLQGRKLVIKSKETFTKYEHLDIQIDGNFRNIKMKS